MDTWSRLQNIGETGKLAHYFHENIHLFFFIDTIGRSRNDSVYDGFPRLFSAHDEKS